MEQVIERENLVRSYLLGELSENQQNDVELRVLTDRDYFHELLLMEGELVDDFVFGVLSPSESERVREHFLAVPERRRSLNILRAISQYVSQPANTNVEHFSLERVDQSLLEFSVDGSSDIELEQSLSAAYENRERLRALMITDWSGLYVLAQVLSSNARQDELRFTDPANAAAIDELIQQGLVEQVEEFLFCTQLGKEVLENLESSLQVRFNP